MKLLVVSRRYPPDHVSGSETVIQSLYEQARRHHPVRLVAGYTRDRSLLPQEAIAVDLRGKRLGRAHLSLARAASAESLRFHPDVVLSNSIEVPRLRPTAVIVHDLNFGRAGRRALDAAREAVYRVQGRMLDRIIAVSEATRHVLLDLGIPQERVVAIRDGVDLHRFHPPRSPVELGGAEGRLVLCYPGRILQGKGQHVAIDAVSRLPDSCRERVHLRIVGAVHDPAYLSQLEIQAFGQPISFHTDVEDIVPFYQEADLVLFPTLMTEGFGYTAIEAMAAGRPVLWSDQPAIREATGGIGGAVPLGSGAAWSAAIAEYLKDPASWEAVGRQGRAFVEAHYGWERVWEQYEVVLEGMV